MKSTQISPVTGKTGDCTVRKKRSIQNGSGLVCDETPCQKRHILAIAISCLFISGFATIPVTAQAAEDYLTLSGGGGGAGGHYNSTASGGHGGGRVNDPGGSGGDSASPGGAGGGGAFIGIPQIDSDAAGGTSSSSTTGAGGGTSFFRPGTGTGTHGQAGADSSGNIGGNGGMGGTATYDNAGDLSVNNSLLYFAGTGGDGGGGKTGEGTGGTGGKGGDLGSTVGNNMNVGHVLLSSGSGGAGGQGGSTGVTGTGGQGGDGGHVTINIANDLNSQGAVSVSAGVGNNGGDAFSGNGGKGGDAGQVILNVGHDLKATQMDVYAGSGGERGYGNDAGIGGEGGKGGDVHITIGNNLTTTGQIGLSGGQGYGDSRDEPTDPADTRGRSKGGDGGSIWFSANNVTTSDIFAVTGNGGGFGSNKDIGGNVSNGKGGAGGSVTVNVTESVSADKFYLYSHLGGMAGDASGISLADGRSGDGGKSGDVNAVVGKDINAPTLFVLATVGGGRGGDANSTGTNVTGGNGGDSGVVNLQINGNLNTSNFTGFMAATGDGGNGGTVIIPPDTARAVDPVQTSGTGGNGGNTGNISLTVARSLTLDNFNLMMAKAGKGGDGNLTSATPGMGGNGGSGGTFSITVGENLTGNAINMVAGEGGDGGNSRGGNGGNSSTVNIAVGQNMTADALVMNGGNGGKAGASDGASEVAVTSGENGGSGGHSILNVTQNLQLNTLTAASGLKGADGSGSVHAGTGGAGGNVNLTADTAILNQGTITKNDGALKVYFNNLDMSNNDTALTLNNTAAYDSGSNAGVQLGTLIFGGGRNLTVDAINQLARNGSDPFAINGIRVLGKDASYTGPSMDASGKNLYFLLPAGMAKDEVMLHSSSTINTEGSHVDVEAAGTIKHLSNGEKVILIDNTSGNVANNGQKTSVFYEGATQYDLAIRSTDSQLILTREGKNVYGQAYAEGQIAGLAAVMQSGDLVARFGDKLSMIEKEGPEVFFSMQGTSEKIKTGSHIKSNGFEAIGGVATHQKTTVGTIHAGVFVEGGWGNYDAYNSFPTLNVKGDGNTRYFGAGVIARHDFDNRFYVEGSLRGGKVKTDYSTNDMGTGASFDSNVWYYGAHGGVGYKIPVRDTSNVDVYGKVLWTQMNSDKLTTGAGENIHFDSADSLRSRLGVRYTHQLDQKVKGFVGVAWDYEFKGKLSSTLDGVAMGEPDMKGSTGLLELGVSWQAQKAWTFDANLRGMAGKHEGITGMVSAKYAF